MVHNVVNQCQVSMICVGKQERKKPKSGDFLELDLSSSKLSLAQAAKYRTVAQAAYADIAVPCLANCWVGTKRSSADSLAAPG